MNLLALQDAVVGVKVGLPTEIVSPDWVGETSFWLIEGTAIAVGGLQNSISKAMVVWSPELVSSSLSSNE